MKQLLAQQEVLFPRLFWSLKTAMLPLLKIKVTGIENDLFGKKSLNDEQEDLEAGQYFDYKLSDSCPMKKK